MRKSRRRYSARATGPGPGSCHSSHRRSPRSHRTDRRKLPNGGVCRSVGSTDPALPWFPCPCAVVPVVVVAVVPVAVRPVGQEVLVRAVVVAAAWGPSCRSRGSAHPFRAGAPSSEPPPELGGVAGVATRGGRGSGAETATGGTAALVAVAATAAVAAATCHRRRHHRRAGDGDGRRGELARCGAQRSTVSLAHRYRHRMGASARRCGPADEMPAAEGQTLNETIPTRVTKTIAAPASRPPDAPMPTMKLSGGCPARRVSLPLSRGAPIARTHSPNHRRLIGRTIITPIAG